VRGGSREWGVGNRGRKNEERKKKNEKRTPVTDLASLPQVYKLRAKRSAIANLAEDR
jgi:hypothetical protein